MHRARMPERGRTAHFFVDEAGDLALFDRSGRIIVGTAGVSHTFLVGVAEISEHERAA